MKTLPIGQKVTVAWTDSVPGTYRGFKGTVDAVRPHRKMLKPNSRSIGNMVDSTMYFVLFEGEAYEREQAKAVGPRGIAVGLWLDQADVIVGK